MKAAFVHFDMPMLPIVALFIFLTIFIGVVIRVSTKTNQKLYQHAETLPLSED